MSNIFCLLLFYCTDSVVFILTFAAIHIAILGDPHMSDYTMEVYKITCFLTCQAHSLPIRIQLWLCNSLNIDDNFYSDKPST